MKVKTDRNENDAIVIYTHKVDGLYSFSRRS